MSRYTAAQIANLSSGQGLLVFAGLVRASNCGGFLCRLDLQR
jgi:hypothetical protein